MAGDTTAGVAFAATVCAAAVTDWIVAGTVLPTTGWATVAGGVATNVLAVAGLTAVGCATVAVCVASAGYEVDLATGATVVVMAGATLFSGLATAGAVAVLVAGVTTVVMVAVVVVVTFLKPTYAGSFLGLPLYKADSGRFARGIGGT